MIRFSVGKPTKNGKALYAYQTRDGKIHEVEFPLGEAPDKTKVKGRIAVRAVRTELVRHKYRPAPCQSLSMAVGVNPIQRKEAYENSLKMGVPTNFNRNGDAEFTDRSHRKRYCEAYGFFDRNAGYSDPTPQPKSARDKERFDAPRNL